MSRATGRTSTAPCRSCRTTSRWRAASTPPSRPGAHLTAGAARRWQLAVVDDDRDRVPVLRLAGCHGGERRAPLGADGQAVRDVLDVRAGMDLVALRADRRTDLVPRIRRVGARAGERRDADEILVPRRQRHACCSARARPPPPPTPPTPRPPP